MSVSCVVVTLIGSVLLPLVSVSESAAVEPTLERRAAIARQMRTGFGAEAGFEVIRAADVPACSCAVAAYGATTSYGLDADPRAFDPSGAGFASLSQVTMLWSGDEQDARPFEVDVFVHDGSCRDDGWAIAIHGLDLRKFLHQSVTMLTGSQRLASLQAYFAEFSRKVKVLRRSCARSAGGSTCRTRFEDQELGELNRRLAKLSDRVGAGVTEWEGLVDALDALSGPNRDGIAEVDRLVGVAARRLRELTAAEDECGRSIVDAEQARELAASFERLAMVRRIVTVHLTNNCREPGNFEVSLHDGAEKILVRANFTFAPRFYDHVLRRHHGLGIVEQATGVEVPLSIARTDPATYREPVGAARAIPHCALAELEPLRAQVVGEPRFAGDIEVARGAIPYHDYERETRLKSAAVRDVVEPLSYVRVDPARPAPAGYDISRSAVEWSTEAAGRVVPHTFATFDDLWSYGVHLSEFEPNGLYRGRNKYQSSPQTSIGRRAFDFRYLIGLTRFALFGDPDGVFEVRLLSEASAGRTVHFVIGNLRLAPGERIALQLGIGEQPLVSDYDDDPFVDSMRYALAFDERGVIVDHHDPDVGVERIYVEREGRRRLRVRLVSHERIVGVWEGRIRLDGESQTTSVATEGSLHAR